MATVAVQRGGWRNASAKANLGRANSSWKVEVQTDLRDVLGGFLQSRRLGVEGANRAASDQTLYEYNYDLERFIKWLTARKVESWQAIKRQHVLDYVSAFRSRVEAGELSESSMWKPLRSLRALFYYVEKQERWELESFRSVLPKIPVNPSRLWIPTPAEMVQFMEGIDQSTLWGFRDYVISCLLLDCGARIGEICNLTPSDIFWDSGMIKLLGKKRVERLVSVSQMKVIPLLKQWEKASSKYKKTPQFFCTRFGGPLQPNAMNHQFAKIRAAAKMQGEAITPHTFRHFFCTYYLVNGGSLHNLKQVTGHEELSTLMIYVHMANELSHVKKEHRMVSPLEHLAETTPRKKRKMF